MGQMADGWGTSDERRYTIRVYPNRTCPIHTPHGIASYRFGMYPIYPILSYFRPDGGESHGLDSHLAACPLHRRPKIRAQ